MNFRMLNCNLWADVFGNPVKEREDCLWRVISRYSPDGVSFEEMHPNWQVSKLVENMKKGGYVTPNVNLGGNPLNYTPVFYRKEKFAELKSGFFKYSGPNDYDSKSVTWAVIEEKNTGKRLCVMATHFFHSQDEYGDNARRQNSRELLRLTSEIREEFGPVPFVCGGDFNCDIHSVPYEILENGGLVCTSKTADVKRNRICSWHDYPKFDGEKYIPAALSTLDNSLSIDHIAVTRGVHVYTYILDISEDSRKGTDHCPVISDIEI